MNSKSQSVTRVCLPPGSLQSFDAAVSCRVITDCINRGSWSGFQRPAGCPWELLLTEAHLHLSKLTFKRYKREQTALPRIDHRGVKQTDLLLTCLLGGQQG